MRRLTIHGVLLLVTQQAAMAQSTGANGTGAVSKVTSAVFDYLSMAGTATTADFRPVPQSERNRLYLRSLANPVLYFKAAFSGGIDHLNNKPPEWQQGASAYGKRTANILGQYGIQRTVTFGLSSMLHEENRYFGSGKKGFWRRTGYAIASSILARHDNGKQYPSVSLIGGFAAAAFVSRAWQPASTGSARDGAVSFGYSMGYNTAASLAKEFLPDIVRPLTRKRNQAPLTTPKNADQGR